MFNSYPLIQKYVIDPYYEERGESNPEYAYLEPLDEEDAIFTDMGGKEAPVASSKEKPAGSKSKGNKKISWYDEKIYQNPLQMKNNMV